MIIHDNKQQSINYAKYYDQLGIRGTQILAFRDLAHYIDKFYLRNKVFLDFGCGAGKSTRYLKQFSSDIEAVDINYHMIEIAKTKDAESNYIHIGIENIPYENERFDFVFSSWVLMELPTVKSMSGVLKEISRVLKPGGININVVCNENTYSREWVSLYTKFEENKSLISGHNVKVKLIDIDLTFFDYYWSEEDYKKTFSESGLNLIDIHFPQGKTEEDIEWKDELKYAPYTMYILQKSGY